ncbi:hypothetical protein Plav_2787 [Parvibaculum lavamentivorans DS-1]|uniref:Uncharacterized protein n=1 Tax=Parvibaculum lavamentivorans (strain DS-1 / DSM 13023 / NCIMB 13966) TaxID=402881 RepID=A7HWW2_PARL1|nr:hypothetical protein [Parvibaculum lavamentivorans]ABS64395.1 hypothetical protein Plav_2787 [Parvibaculum lavamentivorans DS-1]
MFKIEYAASIITAISTVSLLSSVVFNIGYFSFLGFEYIHFLSISDHVIAAILWVPTLLFSAIGIYFSGFSNSISARMVFRFPTKEIGRLQRWAMAVFRTAPIFLGSISLTVAASISTGAYGVQDFNIILFLSSAFVAALVVRWLIDKIRIGFELPLVPVLMATVVMFGLMLFTLGRYWAEKDFERSSHSASRFLMDDGSTRSLGILRAASAGLIVFDKEEKTVSLVRLDIVSSISRRSGDVDEALNPAQYPSISKSWSDIMHWLRREE